MFKWILLFLALTASVFINGTPFIFGDGYGYYHSAKSLTTEGNFSTKNEPSYFEYTGHAVFKNDEGKYTTVYPGGNAIFWIPGLNISNILDKDLAESDYYSIYNGHSLYDGIAVLITASILLFSSIILIFKTLRRIGFSERNAFVSILTVYLSMYIFSYLWYFPSYSHIYELFSFTLLIYLFQKVLLNDGRAYEFLFGISIGLLVLTRVVDVVVTIPFLFYFFYDRRFKTILFTVLGGVPTGLIFLYYNFVVYGSAFSLGYSGDRGGALSLSNFNLLNLLFSDIRGLFIWSPLLIIALIGLVMGIRKHRSIYLLSFISVLFLVGIYTFWPNWWGGDSLGQRFFIVLAPTFVLGLANFIQYVSLFEKKALRIIIWLFILILTMFSAVVQILYRVTPVKTLNTGDVVVGNMSILKEESFTPFDILNYHIEAIRKEGVSLSYMNTLFNSFNGGRSLLLLSLGQTDPLVKAESFGSSLRILIIPNTNGILPNDLQIFIKHMSNSYSIRNIPEGVNLINIVCTLEICTSEEANVLKTTNQLERYISINENFGIEIESASRVNLINRKIK